MGYSVFMVHGEQPPRRLARQALESAGHSVAEAAELAAGWRIAQASRPDLLLLQWTQRQLLRDTLDRLRDEPATSQSRVVVWANHADLAMRSMRLISV